MARIGVAQMREGDVIDQPFLISGKQMGNTVSNKLYLKATCADATGEVHCRMWNISKDVYEKLPAKGFVHVRGRVENYQGHLQLVAENISPITDTNKLELGHFIKKPRKISPPWWPECGRYYPVFKTKIWSRWLILSLMIKNS